MKIRITPQKSVFYQGAVVFSEHPLCVNAVAVSAIVLPHPKFSDLLEVFSQISHSQTQKKKSQMLLHNTTREAFVSAIEAFCNEGTPLTQVLSNAKIEIVGVTDFQKFVYKMTQTIPHGETRTYSWLAARMKRQYCERAVGRALGTNPFPLIVPCHRVIKKDGSLGGFMGNESGESWHVQLKRTLLEHEEKHRQPSLFSGLYS